jgi:hypothetical protein
MDVNFKDDLKSTRYTAVAHIQILYKMKLRNVEFTEMLYRC